MYEGKHSRTAVLAERQRSRKNKRLTALASVALAGVLTVGGTIAWIVAGPSEAENEFISSKVSSEVVETFDGKTKKDVSIKNSGDTDAYVRATFLVNWVDEEGNVYGEAPDQDDYRLTFAEDDQSIDGKWILGADGYYYWTGIVAVGSTTEDLIDECMQTKTAPAEGYTLGVEVICSAIQAKGGKTVDGEFTPAVVDAWEPVVTGVDANKELVVTPMTPVVQ